VQYCEFMYFKSLIPKIFSHAVFAALLCLAAGSLSSLAMAPTNFWYILFISLPVFYCALVFSTRKRFVFLNGWLFAFGYFVFGLYWIGNALLIEGNPYKWAWPLAVVGLPAFLSFYWGLAALLIFKIADLRKFSGWLAFAGIFTLAEWVRGHLFGGFPWNAFGYTWSDHPELLQILGLTDVFGLTLLTIVWASALSLLLIGEKAAFRRSGAFAIFTFAAVHAYGLFMLSVYPDQIREDVVFKIIQPNIPQAEKWKAEKMSQHFIKQVDLSADNSGLEKPVVIVWPETAMTFRFADDPAAMGALSAALQTYAGGAKLLTGLLRYTPEDDAYENSLVMIDAIGEISNIYDKHHLVPFGEYIPFQKYIPLKPIAQFNGFKMGEGLKNFEISKDLRYSPLICYEVIFPGRSIPNDSPRPDFIVTVTNDGWYGISPGPYQHFVQAQYRAVETGIPVIRSANTGFSGVIAPSGVVAIKTELMAMAAVEAALPKARNNAILYPAYKFAFLLFAIFAFIFPAIISKNRNGNEN